MSVISITDLIGIKFKIHGRSKEEGFDCYGLAIEVMKRAGYRLPDAFYCDYSNTDNTKDTLINGFLSLKNAEYLCIILIRKANRLHIGICLEHGLMIHATEKQGVIVEPIARYKSYIEGYYKVKN